MEKVRPWRSQPSDRGRLRNRTSENGYEVGRERRSRLADTDAESDWDSTWCDGITHHPRRLTGRQRPADHRCTAVAEPLAATHQ